MEEKYCKTKLRQVTIRGYKSIASDKPAILDMKDVNIMLGANGAGKSNIVGFFRMLSFMLSGKFASYVEMSGTSNAILHYGPKVTPTISGSLSFSIDNSIETYSFKLSHASPDRLIITEEKISGIDNEGLMTKVALEVNFKESSLSACKNPIAWSIYNFLSGCRVYQFHDSSSRSSMRQACPVETSNYLQSHADNLPAFLYFLRENHKASYSRITDYVRDIIPQFDDFYLEPVNRYVSLKWKDISANDYVFNSCQLSDGSIRFIALATLLLQPEETMPSVIILDEPELGLHPYAVTQLSEMIRDASLHAQIIIATQSKDLVDHFDIDNVTIVETDNGCTRVSHLKQEDYDVWLEQYSISELWDKNIIGGRPV